MYNEQFMRNEGVFYRGKNRLEIAELIMDYELEKDLAIVTPMDTLQFGFIGYVNFSDEELKELYDTYFPEDKEELHI